jgi:hypothetical protein
MYYLAVAGLVAAADSTAPNVIYSASGTFASPPASGADIFQLAGQPFSIRIEANEDLQPTKHTKTSALFTNLVLEGEAASPFFSTPMYISTHRAVLLLETGGAGGPDLLTIYFPFEVIGIPLTISANVALPPGTITTTGIHAPRRQAPPTPHNNLLRILRHQLNLGQSALPPGTRRGGLFSCAAHLIGPTRAAQSHFGGWKRIELRNATLTR